MPASAPRTVWGRGRRRCALILGEVRVLVASTGGAGHFTPLVPFADAFVQQGDEVLLVVPPSLGAAVLGSGRHLFKVGAEPPEKDVAAIRDRLPMVSASEGAVLADRELFGRLCTEAMLPEMEASFESWRPDLVVREPCEYASAIVASRWDVPLATVAISLAEVEMGALALAAPVLTPRSAAVVNQIRAAPYLTRFPAAADPSRFPDTRRFRALDAEPTDPLPDWWGTSADPLVYVTFGSVTGSLSIGPELYRAVLDVMAGVEARVLLTVGHGADVSALGPIPENVHVEHWVPQGSVLAAADVVVCHGGSGTTYGALAAGVPLVIVPLFADQFSNSRCVADAGAGLAVSPDSGVPEDRGRLSPGRKSRLAAAVEKVLGDDSFGEGARRVAAEMRDFPSIEEVVCSLASGGPGAGPAAALS